MTDFEDRYAIIRFADPDHKPIEVAKPLGAGESQEMDKIRRALQYGSRRRTG